MEKEKNKKSTERTAKCIVVHMTYVRSKKNEKNIERSAKCIVVQRKYVHMRYVGNGDGRREG